jgi:5-methyltetrahydropteroyltriglutamate--homocysteine methyltransferase
VRHTHPIFVDAFAFLASVATSRPTISIPGPGMANLMGGRAVVDKDAYPDMDGFWDDLVEGYRAEVAALYAAGTSSSTT